jgi:glycosyltransferase involved in cell wall biosynthesis
MSTLRVLIVSENISMLMGGEASLPHYYATLFAKRGVEVWLACNQRVEYELKKTLPQFRDRICYVEDTPAQRYFELKARALPERVRGLLVAQGMHVSTQLRIRRVARQLAKEGKIDIVFEPAPITPKGISFMYDVGVPVVIGPLCGGMHLPPAFADLDSFVTRHSVAVARRASDTLNRLVPGKLRASVLMVANEATKAALPRGCRGRVIQLFESGVDRDLWAQTAESAADATASDGTVRFAFSGRFVDWKGIQFLLPAFELAVAEEPSCRLDLIGGGGPLADKVQSQLSRPLLKDTVRLHGWLKRPAAAAILRSAQVFVMPSLRECGGTAILEAMAMGKPVITTNWGGPKDYVTEECGLLVDPTSKVAFVEGLAAAMVKLARSSPLRRAMGEAGRTRVQRDDLEWEAKADRVLEVLKETAHPR